MKHGHNSVVRFLLDVGAKGGSDLKGAMSCAVPWKWEEICGWGVLRWGEVHKIQLFAEKNNQVVL